MTRQIIPILSILLGSAFLMLAGGMHGLILPIRGSIEGFPTISLGLLGTGWAIGFIIGCIYTPRLVRRVGHIRTFGVVAAVSVISVLLMLLMINPTVWIILRGLTGFCFAAGAMIVESWLNERTENQYRGRVFGLYTMVNLAATTIGQMAVPLADSASFTLFVLAAIFYALALVPTAVSKAAAPKPLVETGLDLKILWKNSPIAAVASFLIGVSNSSFGTLGAVFGERIGLDITTIALMMSLPILAGAAFQIPVGYFSDKMDRRIVLVFVMAVAAIIDIFLIVANPTDPVIILSVVPIFGAMIYSAYPIIVAHASDSATPGSFIKISGGLLLLYGVGGVIGPIVSGGLMSILPQQGLFITTLAAHILIIAYALVRISLKDAVDTVDKSEFVGMAPGRYATPETSVLDPRGMVPALNDIDEGIGGPDQD
ncbi:MAG: MFS transporter [Salaquimonas sp.]